MPELPSKSDLRTHLRKARRDHVMAQSDAIRALLFHRPPGALLGRIAGDAVIGVYHATAFEAPAAGYANYFQEAGHALALPYLDAPGAPITFRAHTDPFGGSDLIEGPYGIKQPGAAAPELIPDVLFVPLIGFTDSLQRLGQGGGHYDRWLMEHPGRLAIGLAWDAQKVEALPTEPHDITLDAVVTPTRLYGLN